MLQIREKQYHQTKVLALAGQFCPNTNTGIQARILGAKQMGYQHVILDFSGVTEIDSTGLGELFLWYHHMRPLMIPHLVQISVVKPPPYIRYHLDWSHISEIVPIYASEEEAMEHIEEAMEHVEALS
jgi:anti-anti-sigma regulatory factor